MRPAEGGRIKTPGRLSCGPSGCGRLLRHGDGCRDWRSHSARPEGEPHGDRLDRPVSPGVRCLPSFAGRLAARAPVI